MSAPRSGRLPALAAAWRWRWRNHWLDIRFKAGLEESFRDAKIERRRSLISAGLVMAAILQISFVILDYLWFGHHLLNWQAALLFSLITLPHLLLALAVRERLRPVAVQWTILALMTWTALALGIQLTMMPLTDGRPPFGWEGTMVLVIFVCVFTGLRFFQASALCLLVIALYAGPQLWVANDAKVLFYALFYLTSITLLSLVGEYLLERSERHEFLFRQRLYRHLERDFLTGLTNRRMLYQALKLALNMGRRDGRSIAVAMIDVDDFKHFNDEYGHLGGDRCLRRLGTALRQLVRRPLDCTARYGGDEFCVVWYDVDRNGARKLEQRIKEAIREANLPLTVSVGSALIAPDEFEERDIAGRDPTELALEYADARLYQAKLARTNVAAGPVPVSESRERGVQSS